MSLQPKTQISFDDWLESERAAIDSKSEFVHGEVFAMTGASFRHNAIVMNIGSALHAQFKGRPCHVFANDMKVRIETADAGLYPDLVAFCEPAQLQDGRRDVLLNPSLIVEVLSDSTEAYDRGDKFGIYRQIPSLRDYLLVSQHRVQAELYVRGSDHRWTLAEYKTLDDSIRLESVNADIALSEIYDKLDLSESQSAQP